MQRVVIIGGSGSGKSTLAARLGTIRNLPVHHLDSLFWRPGWQETPREQFEPALLELYGHPQWIIDGNYTRTMDARLATCDTVIFLDLPTLTCLAGVIRRYWQYRGHCRPDMGSGCHEKLDWEFIRWVMGYRRNVRPGLLTRLERIGPGKRVITLRSRAQIDAFVREEEEMV